MSAKETSVATKTEGWLSTLAPSMSFSALMALTVAALYLAGVFTSYSKCGDQGACTIMNEQYNTCDSAFCQSWTIIVIAAASLWILSRNPTVHKYLLQKSQSSVWNMIAICLPMFGASVALLVTAIIASTRITDDQEIEPATGVSKAVDGGGDAAVLWLLFGMWTLSMWKQSKVESMIWSFMKLNQPV